MFLESGRKPKNPNNTDTSTGRTCTETLHVQEPGLRIKLGTLALWGSNATWCTMVPFNILYVSFVLKYFDFPHTAKLNKVYNLIFPVTKADNLLVCNNFRYCSGVPIILSHMNCHTRACSHSLQSSNGRSKHFAVNIWGPVVCLAFCSEHFIFEVELSPSRLL